MKKFFIKIFLFCLIFTFSCLFSEIFPLQDLKKFADGLNIEGGIIAKDYLRKDQLWSNLCVVLDRPFEDGIEWQNLTNNNPFPLKEASLLDYNESQVNYAYVTILHYYIMNIHEIMHIPREQNTKILLQVHRNSSGPSHLALLENLLVNCYPELTKIKVIKESNIEFSYFFPKVNVEVIFCHGVSPEFFRNLGKYNDIDLILSLSLVAGLSEKFTSGSLLIPNHYRPFSLKNVILNLDKEYFVKNHLKTVLHEIINTQDEGVLNIINKDFKSYNPLKTFIKAKKLNIEDFKEAILLQVDQIFNPSQLPTTFEVINR